jgi:hypothetical protein
MDNQMTLGVVHIVEWLSAGDAKTGRALFDNLEPLGKASKPEVPVTYSSISTRAEFIALLRRFEDEFRANGRIPVLHIETHGSPDAIGLSADNAIVWGDLMEELIPLNRLTHLRLVVILAACEGFWGVQMLQPGRGAAAFRGLIGPNREVKDWEVLTACMAFYRTVFTKMNGDNAIKAMNDAVDRAKETFWTISPETAFKVVFKGYLKGEGSPEAIERRLVKVEADALAKRRADGLPDMFKRDIERGRERLRAHLSDHRAAFEKFRREFFFVDLYPENDARFDVKFEDCQPEA